MPKNLGDLSLALGKIECKCGKLEYFAGKKKVCKQQSTEDAARLLPTAHGENAVEGK